MNRAVEKCLLEAPPKTRRIQCGSGCKASPCAYLTLFLLMLSAAVLLCFAATAVCSTSLPEVTQLFHQSKEQGGYIPPDPEELDIVENLFVRMLKGERGEQLIRDWQNLGYHLQRAKLQNEVVLALTEEPKRRHGRGFYLFPLVQAQSSLLMIPHRFYDMHTGPIGLKLYSTGSFSAAAWNTVHRHKKSTSKSDFHRDGDSLPNWDLADLKDSYFTALTRAFNRTFSNGHLVQIHGYSKDKRKSWAGRDADIVLSSGTKNPPEDLIQFSDCLKMNLGAMVRVYPIEIQDLGALENVSARILDNSGDSGFIHIEMCLPLRQKLLKSNDLSRVITDCMQESWY